MKRWLLIIISSLVVTLIIYPSAFIYIKDTLPDNNDTRLLAYIIGQVQDNLLNHQPLFYGRFFAPDQNTLAYSDLYLTTSLLTLPFRLLTNSPIAIFNLSFILNTTLTFSIAFFFYYYVFKNQLLALICTALFTLSGFHLHYYAHLQMFSFWLPLLCLYLFLRFLKEGRSGLLLLSFLVLTAQIAESLFPAYLIFFSTLIMFLFYPQKNLKIILLHALPFLPLWLFLVSPYLKLHLALPEATRPINDAAHFSLGLEQIFIFFNSFTFIGIFLLATISKVKVKAWWYVFFFSLVMSLGPVIKVMGNTLKIFGVPIPLPYAIFYYLFPGFTGFRTPGRFIILALLSGTIIIGYALMPLFNKIQTKTKLVIALTIISLLLIEADLPLKGYPVNINLHPVYQEVAALPHDAVIIELPIKLWNMPDHEIESVRSLYSLVHLHRRFGGFSGFATDNWIELVQKIADRGLDQENLSALRSLGVTHKIEDNKLSPLP